MNTLALFESMSTISTTMLEVARANDWDRLAELEREMGQIRNELMRIEPDPRENAKLSRAEQEHKASLIAGMLENDREIRRHVEPWLASTRKLLSGTALERAVRAAYGP
ncbi:flagellar protein FliT [Aromatoleum diolicum]|nr:flagellar protein FliT [Aromatoleum diolicum]